MPDTEKTPPSPPRSKPQKISSRLLKLTIIVSTAAALLTTAIRLTINYRDALKHINEQHLAIISSYSPVLKENLWLANDRETKIVLQGILNLPGVIHAAIVNEDGTPRISAGMPEQDKVMIFERPLERSYKGNSINLGTLKISFTLRHIHQELFSDAMSVLMSQALMILCIAIAITSIFNQLITRHLADISSYFSNLNQENPDVPLTLKRPDHRNDELQQMVSAINEIRLRFLEYKKNNTNLLDSLRLQHDDLLRKNRELDQASASLIESENRNRTILDRSIDGFMITDQRGTITEVNEAYCSLLGYTKEQMLDLPLTKVEALESPEEIKAHIEKVIATGNDRFETQHRHRDGRLIQVELSVNFAPSMGNLFFAFVRDISQRKEAEEILRINEERYRSITETSAEGILQLDREARILFINRAGSELFKVSPEQLPTVNFGDLITEKYRSLFEEYLEMAGTGQRVLAELYVRSDQGKFPISFSLSPLRKDDSIEGFTCICRDITDKRKEEEERLRKSLAEKECLLKEIHHRVKNNMQIVSSLLALQAQNIKNPEIQAVVDDSRNRVRTMSLIHEMLYNNENISMIDFEHYIKKLIRYLLDTHGSARKTSWTIKARDIHLPIDLAIPCGLITTELITNSLKYAFSNGKQGEIIVEMRGQKNGFITFAIRDNGPGFPNGYDTQGSTTLGMSLIKSLAKQLGGEARFYNDHGACFTLSFPMKDNGQTLQDETAQS